MMAIDFINVFYHIESSADNFSCQLFRLIAKADPNNKRRLQMAYPRHVAMYQWWMDSGERPSLDAVREKSLELEQTLIEEETYHVK